AEEKKLAERYFGEDDDFTVSMKMLADAGIKNTRVYVLTPRYVKEHAQKGTLGRASWVDNFGSDSYAYAEDRIIGNHGRLRGVRR
ncbi:hypothetical protein HYX13_00880, partial [Candidatus Woesearchaeota archaeon]|nr:hypothetical protein [Candidatus Woesearchaeota archaeon]